MLRFAKLELGVLQFTGSDRIPFLHGQCTNDVRGLSVGSSCRALVLNAKGQIEFDILVLRRTEDLLVFCPRGFEQSLFERFKRYIIFDDVQLNIVSDAWQVLHLIGADSSQANVNWESNRGFGMGLDVLFAVSELQNLEGALQLENLELARVEASLPDAHSDNFIGLLPQECGLEFAVSYKKGCYIGQEIMARLEARGNTRYELQKVNLSQVVARGTKVLFGSREVGQLGAVIASGTGFVALAVLRRDLEPNAVLKAASVAFRLER
jgi:tRNA-modifying protein YgfZ